MTTQTFLLFALGFLLVLLVAALVSREIRAPYRGSVFLLSMAVVLISTGPGVVLAVIGMQPAGLDPQPFTSARAFGGWTLVECVAGVLDLLAVLVLVVLAATSQSRRQGIAPAGSVADAWDRAAQYAER